MSKAGRRWRVSGLMLLLLTCLPLAGLHAQTLPQRWRWSNPAPHGANIYASTHGQGLTVQVGERGQIYVSEDREYWVPKSTGTTRSLRAVTFFGDRLVVTGEAGTVLYADSLEDFQLVNLNTEDWLEGVASSGTRLVAVGDNGAIYTSTDGANWNRESRPDGSSAWLRGVAWGNNRFVVVGENGFIATGNTTGSSWNQRASGVTTHLNRVAYINDKFWAVGDGGVVLTSNTGTSWSPVSGVSATGNLFDVIGTNQTTLLLGGSELRLSLDGSTWSDELNPAKPAPALPWTYFSGVIGTNFVFASGRSGVGAEAATTNGADYQWVVRHQPVRSWLWDLVRTEKFYLAVGDHGTLLSSVQGVTWDLELTPDSATNSILLGVGGTTNGLVAVGNQGTILFSPNLVTNVVFTNADTTTITNPASMVGIVWHAVEPRPVAADLQGVAWSNGLFVVTGAEGTILNSTDGTNWQTRASPTTKFLSSVAVFPGGFVATGDGGTILTSADGASWTARASGVTNWLFRTRWLHDRLVAVGEEGVILTSPDGVTWTPRTSGTTNWLNHAAYAANTWYAAGNRGTLLASASTLTWTNAGTLTEKSLYGLATDGNGQLVAAGLEGVILRTQLTPLMDPVKFLDFGAADGEQVFLLSAKPDVRFALQQSTNLVDWVEGLKLEILDPSGTILFRQKAFSTNQPAEFFRALTTP